MQKLKWSSYRRARLFYKEIMFRTLSNEDTRLEPITFAELSTMVYFSLDAEKYLNADEAEFKQFDLDTELVYLRVKDTVVLVFKGSCTMTDWFYNLKFWKKDFAYGDFKIHRGMGDKLQAMFHYLKAKIKPADKVYLTGHSLGGALSVLSAYILKTQISANIEGVYLFGAPRVGGPNWKKAYDSILFDKTFSYQNHGDLIPSLPPKWLGYHHVGQHIELKSAPHEHQLFPSSNHLPWIYVINLR